MKISQAFMGLDEMLASSRPHDGGDSDIPQWLLLLLIVLDIVIPDPAYIAVVLLVNCVSVYNLTRTNVSVVLITQYKPTEVIACASARLL